MVKNILSRHLCLATIVLSFWTPLLDTCASFRFFSTQKQWRASSTEASDINRGSASSLSLVGLSSDDMKSKVGLSSTCSLTRKLYVNEHSGIWYVVSHDTRREFVSLAFLPIFIWRQWKAVNWKVSEARCWRRDSASRPPIWVSIPAGSALFLAPTKIFSQMHHLLPERSL